MHVKQFRYFNDNLGYLVHTENEGIVIDAGGVDAILDFINKKNISLTCVTNTHSHSDHTSGNAALIEKTGARFLDCRQITGDETIQIEDEVLEVFPTPGHTTDSVCFLGDGFLITGDTLFNGTVGNCFSGDLQGFFNSLKRLFSYPSATMVYGGHDYVLESLQIAQSIEPDNPNVETYKKRYDPGLIVSTLADELEANPYVRFNAESMINNLKKKNMPVANEFERFKSIMEIY